MVNSIFGNLDDLYLFCCISESGSLQKGAKRLNQPVSTVSRRLSQLESRLGVKLLEKRGRELAATSAGKELYARLKPELNLAESSLDDFLEQSDRVQGHIRLTSPYTMYATRLRPVTQRFLADYPDITLDIELNLIDAMPETNRDLVITFDLRERQDVIARPLFKADYLLAASRDYLERCGEPTTIEELEQHQWLQLSSHPSRRLFESAVDFRPQLTPRLKINDVGMLLEAASAGLGIAAVPTHHFEPGGSLVQVMKEHTLLSAQAWLVYRQRQHQPKALSLLIDTLLQEFGSGTS